MAQMTKRRAGKSGGLRTVTLSESLKELPEGTWERIARKAYELWEARGRRDGRRCKIGSTRKRS
jgi:hypothetical protein